MAVVICGLFGKMSLSASGCSSSRLWTSWLSPSLVLVIFGYKIPHSFDLERLCGLLKVQKYINKKTLIVLESLVS